MGNASRSTSEEPRHAAACLSVGDGLRATRGAMETCGLGAFTRLSAYGRQARPIPVGRAPTRLFSKQPFRHGEAKE